MIQIALAVKQTVVLLTELKISTRYKSSTLLRNSDILILFTLQFYIKRVHLYMSFICNQGIRYMNEIQKKMVDKVSPQI